jgi:hypothetical protein
MENVLINPGNYGLVHHTSLYFLHPQIFVYINFDHSFYLKIKVIKKLNII